MDLRRTPFHAHHVDAGARMVPFADFDMPLSYGGTSGEHLQVRRSVGLFDVSHMGEVRVRGPRAEDALMHLLSNAIRRLGVGGAQYNAMCNERGGIVDDVFVSRLAADDFLVCVNAANRAKDFNWMVANNPHGADLVDEGDDWAQLAIQGPAGVAVADALTPEHRLSDLPRRGLVQGSFAGVGGCVIARTGYTGEDGVEVFLPASSAAGAWPAVLEVGADKGIVPVGLGARDTLRLEAGNCLYGNELSDDTSPLQAGLGWITKLRKPGGFVGSDAIAARRVTDARQLVRLVMLGKRIPRPHMDVRHADDVVGEVTSGTKGPFVDRGVALAYVDRNVTEPGTELIVDVRGRNEPARIIAEPFTDWARAQA